MQLCQFTRVGPAVSPGTNYHVGILRPAQAAIVAAQGAEQIALFDVEIVPKDGAAVAQVGADVEQILVGGADIFDPEWHYLHVAPCPGTGYGIFLEAAFDLD